MLQKLMVPAIALAVLAVCGCKPSMTEFTSTEYKFKVKFPGKPKIEDQTAAKGMKFRMYGVEARNGMMGVGVSDMPIGGNEPDELVQQMLDAARDAELKKLGATLKSSTPIRLAGKYPGREFSASITQPRSGQLRTRVYLVGARLYQIMVMGTDSYATSADANTFLDSFQLLE